VEIRPVIVDGIVVPFVGEQRRLFIDQLVNQIMAENGLLDDNDLPNFNATPNAAADVMREMREQARQAAIQQQLEDGYPEQELPLPEEEPCGICLTARASWKLDSCNHLFCLPCIVQLSYVAEHSPLDHPLGKCPYCRVRYLLPVLPGYLYRLLLVNIFFIHIFLI